MRLEKSPCVVRSRTCGLSIIDSLGLYFHLQVAYCHMNADAILLRTSTADPPGHIFPVLIG